MPEREERLGWKAILFSDIVGSTRLKQLLGDRKGVALIQRHHALVRETLAQFETGKEIETAGDSFLILFENSPDAVKFALVLQARLRGVFGEDPHPILDRVGIHCGEIFIREHEGAAKVLGTQVDLGARVMSLALGGQILMSRGVFDAARQVVRPLDLGDVPLIWLNHGPYQLKGIEEPVEICEVGEKGQAPERAPLSSSVVERQATSEIDSFFAWRPAIGQKVPKTQWVLQEKLGEGGFGEVWLGSWAGGKENRVFKFCFRLDRARALKREVTLFRLLIERIGEHPNVVKLLDVCVDEQPFYLAEEYIAGKDLKTWCQGEAGKQIPLATRIELVAQSAEGLQAAHDAGVIHRDIKPGNILISTSPRLQAKLSDFGVGQLASNDALEGLTQAGFTLTVMSAGSSQSGTQMYMAPELYSGQPASIRSDIYSLGVVLYQLLIGDFCRPLTSDWTEKISDPLLREDLMRCFASNPSDRFEGAGQLGKNLRSLEQRRAARAQQEAETARRERAAYRKGVMRAAGIAALILAVIAILGVLAYRNGLQSRERLLRSYRATGLQLMEKDDLLASLPWLVEALALDRNPTRVHAGRTRIGAVLRKAPKLVQVWAHKDMVTGADFSRDGRVVTASKDGTIQIWNPDSGEPVIPPIRQEQPVYSVAFSPDGSRLVSTSADDTVRLWDAATGKPVGEVVRHHARNELGQTVYAAFSADGKTLVTCGGDRLVRLFDPQDGREQLPPIPHESALNFAAFSPAGDKLIVCGATGRLWIRNSRDGTLIHSSMRHGAEVRSARFSGDGQRVVTCSSDETAQVWDVSTGKPVGVPLRHEASVVMGEFSSDGRWVLTCSYDRTARLWDAATGLPVRHPLRHEHSVVQASFSPDGRYILTSSHDHTARVWDAMTSEVVFELKHNGFVLFSGFAPNGHQILTTSQDNLAKLWDIAGDLAAGPLFHHGDRPITWVCFSPNTKLIASASQDGSAVVWNPGNGAQLMKVEQGARINTIAFSPDSRRIITASDDRTARVWEVSSGRPIGQPMQHGGRVASAFFSRSGTRVVTASEDGTARIWDASTSAPVTAPLRHEGPVKWAVFSPDEKKVGTGSSDLTARIWDTATGSARGLPLHHDAEIRYLTFSPNSQTLATACADAFDPFLYPARSGRMWDVTTAKPVGAPLQHSDGVLWVDFSPNGRLVVTASEDGTARIFKASSGNATVPPLKHNWQVTQAQFSPDGYFVMTAGRDATVRLWDVPTGDPLMPVLRHPVPNLQNLKAALSPDGTHIVTGTEQGALYVWSVPIDLRPVAELTMLAQLLAGRKLDPLVGPTSVDADTFLAAWRTFRVKSPGDFQVPARQVAIWHLLQTEYCQRQQMWDGAVFHWGQLIAAQPANPKFRQQRGQIRCAQHQWQLAVADLDKCVELDPKNVPAYELLAQARQAMGQDAQAIEAYTKAIALQDTPEPRTARGLKLIFAARARLLERQNRTQEAMLDRMRALGIPPRDARTSPAQIDLSGFYNIGFEDDLHGIQGNNLVALPTGLHTLAGIDFDLRGIVQLANQGELEKTCPSQVTNIPVRQKCRKIHFLQGAAWGGRVPPGTPIGSYILHFADGTRQTIEIRYDRDVLDWWQPPGKPEALNQPAVAWTGENKAARVRLFKGQWENPTPGHEIVSLDYVSTMTPTAAFLVAVSLE